MFNTSEIMKSAWAKTRAAGRGDKSIAECYNQKNKLFSMMLKRAWSEAKCQHRTAAERRYDYALSMWIETRLTHWKCEIEAAQRAIAFERKVS